MKHEFYLSRNLHFFHLWSWSKITHVYRKTIVIVTANPFGERVRAETFPPHAMTQLWTIVSPKPVPPVSFVREASTPVKWIKNLVQIRLGHSIYSSADGCPVNMDTTSQNQGRRTGQRWLKSILMNVAATGSAPSTTLRHSPHLSPSAFYIRAPTKTLQRVFSLILLRGLHASLRSKGSR